MAIQVQHRRGTTAQHTTYTGPVGEITIDTTKKTAVVQDGVTAGGNPLATESYVNNVTGVTAKNYLINPSGAIAQETLGTRTDGQYDFDQWIVLTQTASVTPSVINDPEDGLVTAMRITQSQSTAQRLGRIQWIESRFCRNLRGKNAVATARVRASASTKIRYAIIAWTGTADAIKLDAVADWTSTVFTPNNFFYGTTTSIVAIGSLDLTANTFADLPVITGAVPSSMNNLAFFIWTDSAQAQNVTIDVANCGLYEGTIAPKFIMPDYDYMLFRCCRYYQVDNEALSMWGAAVTAGVTYYHSLYFPVPMRIVPSVTFIAGNVNNGFPNAPPTDTAIFLKGLRAGAVASATANSAFFTYGWRANARLVTV